MRIAPAPVVRRYLYAADWLRTPLSRQAALPPARAQPGPRKRCRRHRSRSPHRNRHQQEPPPPPLPDRPRRCPCCWIIPAARSRRSPRSATPAARSPGTNCSRRDRKALPVARRRVAMALLREFNGRGDGPYRPYRRMEYAAIVCIGSIEIGGDPPAVRDTTGARCDCRANGPCALRRCTDAAGRAKARASVHPHALCGEPPLISIVKVYWVTTLRRSIPTRAGNTCRVPRAAAQRSIPTRTGNTARRRGGG